MYAIKFYNIHSLYMDEDITIIHSEPTQLNKYVPLTNTEVDFARYTNLLFVDHGASDTGLHLQYMFC